MKNIYQIVGIIRVVVTEVEFKNTTDAFDKNSHAMRVD